jgi:YD repeat-containing protein
MKFKSLFFMVAIVLGMSACTQKPATSEQDNVKYYKQLLFSETPWDLERGSHPVSAEEAKTVNNYKFTWNEDGTLASVEYNRNGVLLGYSNLRAAKITYTYEGNKQIKHFYDENGEPTSSGGVFALEYTLDDSGMRTALRFLDENGEGIENRNNIHNYVWSKLPDGMIRELRYNLAGEETIMNPFCPFYELRFTYDSNGFVTRMANYQADTLYDCTAENCGDVGVSYFTFENNEKGDLLSFSVHSSTGQLSNLYWGWAKRQNTVDENGNVVETIMFDQDNEYLGGKNIPVTQNIYDEHGSVIKSISMDADKNVLNNPNNGVAIVEYKYDEQGRRTETLRYDKDMNPVESNS